MINPVQIVVDTGFGCKGQGMQHGVGATAHGHVEDERIVDGILVDNIQRPEVFRQASLQHRGRVSEQLNTLRV